MPANLKSADPVGVFPNYQFVNHNEGLSFPILTAQYHDGRIERKLITDTVNPASAIRTFRFTVRLSAEQVIELREFYADHQGPTIPFTFYHPLEGTWDGSGNSSTGRYTVRFTTPQWNEVVDVARTNVTMELQEVA